MNYKMVFNTLGKVMVLEAVLLLFPMCIGFIYNESSSYGIWSYMSYIIPMLCLVVIGLPLSFIKTKEHSIYAREGFVTVALAWIILSLAGAIPFVLIGATSSYVDAFFETVSGFTTTGASIMPTVENLPISINFWRTFTHWIGGMGVLVFVLAIVPKSSGGLMYLFKAESPGPTSGKLVSKLSYTARILYLIYIVLTFIEFIMLICGGMPVFDSVCNAFATAGTGGFSIKNDSIASYSTYSQMVIAVFMFIFGINFNFFYLILIGNFAKAFKNEEIITYFSIVVITTLLIAINLINSNVSGINNFGDALKNSFFHVTSLSSSTGFSISNFDAWPTFSKTLLLFLMLFGACAGSTGGGMKISRLIILTKSSYADLRKTLSKRKVMSLKVNGESISQETVSGVRTYFACWFFIVVLTVCLISIGGYNGGDTNIETSLTATLSCIGNIGPGLNFVGPLYSYAGFSSFSKIWLSFVMLAGRLEIIPILYLFFPRTWKKNI